jgi:hypothetical protein
MVLHDIVVAHVCYVKCSSSDLHLLYSVCFSYIQGFPVVNEEQKGDFTFIGDLMKREFIGQQLILIMKSLDTSEEGGRYV